MSSATNARTNAAPAAAALPLPVSGGNGGGGGRYVEGSWLPSGSAMSAYSNDGEWDDRDDGYGPDDFSRRRASVDDANGDRPIRPAVRAHGSDAGSGERGPEVSRTVFGDGWLGNRARMNTVHVWRPVVPTCPGGQSL